MTRLGAALALGVLVLGQPFHAAGDERNDDFDHVIIDNARQLVDQGRQIFRYDTFGDEDFWGGELHLHEAIAGAQHDGVGPGLGPSAALGIGLKVDVDSLPALHFYQLAIPAPRPPAGSFDVGAADRGRQLFEGKARCASCHVPPLYTEPGWNTHTAAEIGIDDFQSGRDPDRRYRTTPLAGLWTHGKAGYYHDGRFATLPDVIRHYDRAFGLGLASSS
jgi:hypothetical protein